MHVKKSRIQHRPATLSTLPATGHKERVTLSLSGDAVNFIDTFQREGDYPSVSASVEGIIKEAKRARELRELEESTKAYYDSLSDAEIQEQAAWGEAGAYGLAAFDAETEPKSPKLNRARR